MRVLSSTLTFLEIVSRAKCWIAGSIVGLVRELVQCDLPRVEVERPKVTFEVF